MQPSMTTPRSFTPYTRRVSMSPSPAHIKIGQVSQMMTTASTPSLSIQGPTALQRSMDQMKKDFCSSHERLSKLLEAERAQRASTMASLQKQVDGLQSTVAGLWREVQAKASPDSSHQPTDHTPAADPKPATDPEPTPGSHAAEATEVAEEESQGELQKSLAATLRADVSQAQEELRQSVKAAEDLIRAKVEHSFRDIMSKGFADIERLDARVAELSDILKPVKCELASPLQQSQDATVASSSEPEVRAECGNALSKMDLQAVLTEGDAPSRGWRKPGSEAGTDITTLPSPRSQSEERRSSERRQSSECRQSSERPDPRTPTAPLEGELHGKPQVPVLQRRSTAPGLYHVATSPSARTTSATAPTILQAIPRLQLPGAFSHRGSRRSTSPFAPPPPSTMTAAIWGGGSARLPSRAFVPESGSLVGSGRSPIPCTTIQQSSQMNQKDQETARLEAMRLAVAMARQPPGPPAPLEGESCRARRPHGDLSAISSFSSAQCGWAQPMLADPSAS
ncbi:unnamed protein product [Effrenium voratum]|nr:unnamed protein product [Effrenium voratum]